MRGARSDPADFPNLLPFPLHDGHAYGIVANGIGHVHTATDCP